MDDFHWLAFFQRSSEAVFLLNRHRRILWVNRAWEDLTGFSRAEARGLACRVRRLPPPEDAFDLILARALAPPREVLEGKSGRARRLVHLGESSQRWDIEFFPLRDADGLVGVLGKVLPLPSEEPGRPTLGIEKLVNLSATMRSRHDPNSLGTTPAMHRVGEQVRLAGQMHTSVMIRGESGVGKEWIARMIHEQSGARRGPFAVLDCRRLPGVAVAAALFEGGRLVRRAGTIFLREPACLPRDLQSVLSIWLAEAGPEAPRLIAGCRTPLGEDVRAERLMDDLAVLSMFVIDVPPLRERLGDLTELASRMLHEVGGSAVLTRDALTLLLAHRWPGNLRELMNVLIDARGHARQGRIDAAHLPMYLRMGATPPARARKLPLVSLLEQAERQLIALALRECRGKLTRAAEMLEVNRPYLYRRLKDLGLDRSEGGEK